eukprot:1996121-Prymnesium_polylepis.2
MRVDTRREALLMRANGCCKPHTGGGEDGRGAQCRNAWRSQCGKSGVRPVSEGSVRVSEGDLRPSKP